MKPKFLAAIVCFLLRAHKWRRLRKSEWHTQGISLAAAPLRICGRCGVRRAIKSRKAAA